WNALGSAKVDNFHWDEVSFDQVRLEIAARDGVATLRAGEFIVDKNKLTANGTVVLPDSSKDLGRDGLSLEITGSGLQLANITAGSKNPLAGKVDITGKIETKKAKLDAAFTLAGASVRFPDGGIDKLKANVRATKALPPPDTKQAWFADLHSVTDLEVENLRSVNYQF